MSTKNPIAKVMSYVVILGLFIYVVYNLKLIYESSASISNFVDVIWNYTIIKNSDFQLTIGKLFLEIGLLIGSYYLAQLITNKIMFKILLKTKLDLGGRASVLKLFNYFIFLTFIIFSLSIAQIPLTAFTFIGGALAIGAGFGSQNMINNFISGIIIQIEKPIKVGDTVQLDNQIGKIDEIGVRSTKVLLSNDTHLIIPNSFFLEKNITNWHFRGDLIKSKILVELDLNQNLNDFKEKISTILSNKSQNLEIQVVDIKPTGYVVEVISSLNIDLVNKNHFESQVRQYLLELHLKKEIKLASSAK